MLITNKRYFFWIISFLTHGGVLLVLSLQSEDKKKSKSFEMIAVEWLSPSSQVGHKEVIEKKKLKRNKKSEIENQNEAIKNADSKDIFQEEGSEKASNLNEFNMESMGGEGGGTPTPRSLYFGQVMGLLNQHKRYPPMARQLGIQGVVKLRLKVNRSGEISQADVLSFEHELLKQAAIRMIEELKKFPPPTFGFEDEAFFVSIPIRYQLR